MEKEFIQTITGGTAIMATSLPSQFNYLQTMRLLIDVEFKLAGNESFAAVAIKQAIRDGKPAKVVLSTIKDMAQDNYNGVCDMVGVKITDKILAL